MSGAAGLGARGCYSARMFGYVRVAACCAALLQLAACGDDSPTNRPPEDDDGTSAPTSWTTTPTATLSGDTTESDGETDASDTDTGDPSDTTSTTGEGEFCPATHRCVVEVPEGWEGPGPALTAAAAKGRPACEAAYPDAGAMGFDGLDAPPADCTCECNEPNGTECESSTTLRYWGSSQECSEGSSTQVTVFAGLCTNLPSVFPGDAHWQIDVIAASGGTCSRQEEELVAEAVWESQVVTCGGAELLGGCAVGHVCAPRPETEDVPLCVWRQGEHACPEGWDDARTVWTDINDTRGCAPCTCGEPVGLCDDARITMMENFNCNVPIANQFDADGECHEGSGISVRAAAVATGSPLAFCTPSEPMPVGEAIGADAITLCCG